jgi:hypothetical protein
MGIRVAFSCSKMAMDNAIGQPDSFVDESPNSKKFGRQFFALLLGTATAAAGLWICYWMVSSGGFFGLLGVSVLPAVVGLMAGLAMRYSCAQGSFNLASAGIAMILVFGLACSAVRHKVLFDQRLKQEAVATYEATRTYAQNIVPVAAADGTALRHFMFTNQISFLGRITPVENGDSPDEYWKSRNFVHLHWVAARQIVLYGQSGVDRTIAEASSVLGDNIFLDKNVANYSKDYPVTDDDMRRFRQYELPFLMQMKDGKIAADDFERPLIREVNSRVNWRTFAFNGFEPFLLIAMLWGSIFVYKLVRQPEEMEIV